MEKMITNLILVLISCLIALLMAELSFRIIFYKSLLLNHTTSHHKAFCEYDELLGWKHKSNVKITFDGVSVNRLVCHNVIGSKSFKKQLYKKSGHWIPRRKGVPGFTL